MALSWHEEARAWGLAEPEPQPTVLRAGPVTLDYSRGFLRRLRLGDAEVLRLINFAVRDRDWNTLPLTLVREKLDTHDDHFAVECELRFTAPPIDYAARVTLVGERTGRISCTFRGQALSRFQRNRIGFTVLHPPAACAGAPVRVRHPDGTEEAGRFPQLISPHQPFFDIAALTWTSGGRELQLQFEGEVFEMEDQRNWTDASYKTYCTPLGRPFPVPVEVGEQVHQRITFTVSGPAVGAPTSVGSTEEVRLTWGSEPRALPRLGVARSREVAALSDRQVQRLQALQLSHYRLAVDLTADAWRSALQTELRDARQLGWALEVVVLARPGSAFGELAEQLQAEQVGVASLLLLSCDAKCTTGDVLAAAVPVLRQQLPDVPLGAGTDAFFTELNRQRPPLEGLDFVSFSVNPQVHAFDRLSLVENLEAQADVVASAQVIAGPTRAVHVSPVTLRMRWNPNATSAPAADAARVPIDLDLRQASLFGAGWTLGSLLQLANAGAKAVTFYETVGTRGLMQGDAPVYTDVFPVPAGGVYPVYHLLRDVAGSETCQELVGDPRVSAGCFRRGTTSRVLLANHTPEPLRVVLPPRFRPTTCRWMTSEWYRTASDTAPLAEPVAGGAEATVLLVPPFALGRIDGVVE